MTLTNWRDHLRKGIDSLMRLIVTPSVRSLVRPGNRETGRGNWLARKAAKLFGKPFNRGKNGPLASYYRESLQPVSFSLPVARR